MNDDARRRRYEQLILIAIIVGPLSIWFFKNGMHWTVLGWIRATAYLVADYSVPILAETFFALTLLATWRHPLIGKRIWPLVVVILLAIGLNAVGRFLISLVFTGSFGYGGFDFAIQMAGLDLMQRCVMLGLSLGVFVAIRRLTGACLLRAEVNDAPKCKALSIAELMYWTAAFAVLWMVIARIKSHNLDLGTGIPPTLVVTFVAMNLVASISPVLILIMMPARISIRLLVAVICVVAVAYCQLYLLARFYQTSVPMAYFEWLRLAFMHTAGAGLATGWVGLKGERFVWLSRKAASLDD